MSLTPSLPPSLSLSQGHPWPFAPLSFRHPSKKATRHACTHVCMYVCRYAYIHVCIYVCVHACMHHIRPLCLHHRCTCTPLTYTDVYIHMHMYMNMCTDRYTCTHLEEAEARSPLEHPAIPRVGVQRVQKPQHQHHFIPEEKLNGVRPTSHLICVHD